jgi:uncharacterized protein
MAFRAELRVAPSPVHGRGVFAARRFRPGDLIEECPIVLVPADRAVALRLGGYCFEWSEDEVAVTLGYGSLYNHSWDPNARYDHDHTRDVVSYTAIHHIEAGDEITINYSGAPDGRADLWFDDR